MTQILHKGNITCLQGNFSQVAQFLFDQVSFESYIK